MNELYTAEELEYMETRGVNEIDVFDFEMWLMTKGLE